MAGERIWSSPEDSGVMSQAEATRQIKQLWRTTDELKSGLHAVQSTQVEQGKTLVRIEANTTEIARALTAAPNWSVEHAMRLKALEESVSDLEDKKQCEGCKNDPRLQELVKQHDICRADVDALKMRVWYMSGGFAVLGTAGGWVLKALIGGH